MNTDEHGFEKDLRKKFKVLNNFYVALSAFIRVHLWQKRTLLFQNKKATPQKRSGLEKFSEGKKPGITSFRPVSFPSRRRGRRRLPSSWP
jgi:hypothetical protein